VWQRDLDVVVLTVYAATFTVNGDPNPIGVCFHKSGVASVPNANIGGAGTVSYVWAIDWFDDGSTDTATIDSGQGTSQINFTDIASLGTGYGVVDLTVRVTTSTGCLSTNRIRLTAVGEPTASTPANQTVCVGQTATFNTTVNSQPNPSQANLSAQWQASIDGGLTYTNIPGAITSGISVQTISSTYTTPALTSTNNNTRYRVFADSGCANTNSLSATLTVNSPPAIAVAGQPADLTVCSSNNAVFTVRGDRHQPGLSVAQERRRSLAAPGTRAPIRRV